MRKKHGRTNLITDKIPDSTDDPKVNLSADREKDDPNSKRLHEILESIEVSPEVYEIGKSMQAEILTEVNERIDRHIRKRLFYRISAVAACISSLIIISLFFYNPHGGSDYKNELLSELESTSIDVNDVHIVSGTNQKKINNEEIITQTEKGDIILGKDEKIESAELKSEYITIVVPKGKRSSIKFSDGSVAWINSGSKLIYPKVFTQKTRDIFLDGEIYIDVAPNKEKPFYVHTKKFDINVLGTQFNVNAYSEDTSNSVILVKGSVSIDAGNHKKELLPNQGFFNDNDNIIIKNVDVYSFICWRNGILKLDNEPFNSILKKLSRYYGINIELSQHLNNIRFDGSLDLRDSIEEVLTILSISEPFKFERKNDTIYVS